MNPNQEYANDRLMDAINILSLVIGLENMRENQIQSQQNDVSKANEQQAEYLLNQIKAQFERQNEMLVEILDRLNGVS